MLPRDNPLGGLLRSRGALLDVGVFLEALLELVLLGLELVDPQVQVPDLFVGDCEDLLALEQFELLGVETHLEMVGPPSLVVEALLHALQVDEALLLLLIDVHL